ncbi:hypothetical protein JTE90_021193 [Oedothorax gibbosus]|uniref:Uncharacterized protein n=1 Tax=Oedothorax gibbosus TaxID=931172 RepID=A0AAV6V7F3_9ARAC|nr:hypothetical protein JTE90_021193 [Oedothorax gibbosus]
MGVCPKNTTEVLKNWICGQYFWKRKQANTEYYSEEKDHSLSKKRSEELTYCHTQRNPAKELNFAPNAKKPAVLSTFRCLVKFTFSIQHADISLLLMLDKSSSTRDASIKLSR